MIGTSETNRGVAPARQLTVLHLKDGELAAVFTRPNRWHCGDRHVALVLLLVVAWGATHRGLDGRRLRQMDNSYSTLDISICDRTSGSNGIDIEVSRRHTVSISNFQRID